MWDYSLVFAFSQCSPLFIASLINLHAIKFDTNQNLIASVLSLSIIFATGLTLVIILLGLRQDSEKLPSLNEGMRESGKYWRWYELLRQCLTMVILVEGRDLGSFQILALLVSSLFAQALTLHFKPYEDPWQNAFSFFNEYAVSVFLYLMLLLSDLNRLEEEEEGTRGLQVREIVGWALLALMTTVVLVNFAKAIFFDIKALKLFFMKKLAKLRASQKKEVKKYPSHGRSKHNYEIHEE
jgi:hypothetical protein